MPESLFIQHRAIWCLKNLELVSSAAKQEGGLNNRHLFIPGLEADELRSEFVADSNEGLSLVPGWLPAHCGTHCRRKESPLIRHWFY